MKKIIFFTLFILLNSNSGILANDKDCKEFKKLSVDYLKCKGNKIKDKTISTGQNIVKETKEYQKKEWSEEKEKVKKVKNKINKAKEKVIE
jgi:tRNA A22 N-methylase